MNGTASESRPGLIRALGPFTAMAVVVGTVIGSGIFLKPQQVAENVPFFGPAALVWILGGLLALLGALALAEVAVLYPKAGGNYVFLREGYGRLFGFLWGWVEFWIIRGASLAALATAFSESLHDVLANDAFQQTVGLRLGHSPLGFWAQRALTVAVILGLALVNVRGVRWGGGLQLFITAIKIASLLGIMALPFVVTALLGGSDDALDSEVIVRPDIARLAPWWGGFSLGNFGAALVGVLFAYHGWMNIVPVAEEVRNPQRNLPLSLLAGTLIVIFLYLGANLAYYLVIPQAEMAEMKTSPVATQFCLRLLGPIGAAAASAAVMCSTFGALNGNLLVGPRLLYAMGEDGLAPRSLGAVHSRYHTPALAILIMAAWASILVVLAAGLKQYRIPELPLLGDLNVPADKSLFNILTDFAMFGALIFETLAVASIFVFRRTLPDADRPYRCVGYPLVPALYVGLMALVVANKFVQQWTEALVGVAFIALGALVYAWLGRRTVQAKDGFSVP